MPKNTPDLIRKRLIELRSQIPVAQRQRGSLLIRGRLFTWLGLSSDRAQTKGFNRPLVVAAFWALDGEPELEPLLAQWDEAGVVVTLPVMVQKDAPLEFHRWTTDTPMTEAKFGVMEPPKQQALIPDVILVPTLGFTEFADRIGYGKGFYDRTLHALRSKGIDPVTIGISWDEGAIEPEFPEYQAKDHDEQLDTILTPTGWTPREIQAFDK